MTRANHTDLNRLTSFEMQQMCNMCTLVSLSAPFNPDKVIGSQEAEIIEVQLYNSSSGWFLLCCSTIETSNKQMQASFLVRSDDNNQLQSSCKVAGCD